MKRPVAQFPGLTPPSTDFESVLDGMRSPLLMLEVDLSTARSFAAGTAQQIKITGNSFYIDQAPDVGNAYVIFEGVQDDTGPKIRPAVYVQPGYVARVPFANVRIVNSAQAGKVLRIIYGVDVDFVPSLNGQIAISGTVSATPYPFTYANSHKSATVLAAGVPETVFTPAANVNGALLYSMQFVSRASLSTCALAKNGAPASVTDGDGILTADTIAAVGGDSACSANLQNPVLIPAGKGLYFISASLEVTGYRSALWTYL